MSQFRDIGPLRVNKVVLFSINFCAENPASNHLHLPVNCSSSLCSHGDMHTHNQPVSPLKARENVL